MDVSKDLIAASSTPLVLAILSKQDSYGYEIIKRIKEASNNEINWTEGMLYPLLHKLEGNGFIRSYWKESTNGRKRKYYAITEAGLQELEEHKKQWTIVYATLSAEMFGHDGKGNNDD